MVELLVSTSADLGGGFRRDPSRSSETLPPDVEKEFEGLPALHVQLQHPGGNDPGVAVVTAKYSPRLQRWTGILQGSGGSYGPAGTVQYATTDAPLPLVSFLALLLEVADDAGFLRPGPCRDAALPAVMGDPSALAEPLGQLLNLHEKQRVLILRGKRSDALLRLSSLAGFLPEQVARGYTWSSGLAVSRVVLDEYVITADWPEQLREHHDALYRPLAAMAASPDTRPEDGRPQGLAWALDQARNGVTVGRDSSAASITEWLAELELLRPLDARETRALLARPLSPVEASRWQRDDASGSLLLASRAVDGRVLTELLQHPSEVVVTGAVRHLRDQEVFRKVVALERERASHGEAPLVPVDLLDPSFLRDLANQVAGRWSAEQLLDARPWLTALGLSRRNAAALFPLSHSEVVSQLQRDPLDADQAVTFAMSQKDPQRALSDLTQAVPDAAGPISAVLVGTSSRHSRPYLESIQGLLRSGRKLRGYLAGASAYAQKLQDGPATAVRNALFHELLSVMRDEGQAPLIPPWEERNASSLVTFAAHPKFSEAMVALTRRRYRRFAIGIVIAVPVLVVGWMWWS